MHLPLPTSFCTSSLSEGATLTIVSVAVACFGLPMGRFARRGTLSAGSALKSQETGSAVTQLGIVVLAWKRSQLLSDVSVFAAHPPLN